MFKIFCERDVGGEVTEGREGIHNPHDFAEVMEVDGLEFESVEFMELGEMSTQDDLLCWRECCPIHVPHLHRFDLCQAWNICVRHHIAEKNLFSDSSSAYCLRVELSATLFSHSHSLVIDLDTVDVVCERALLGSCEVEKTLHSPRPELYGGEYVVAAANKPFRANDSTVPKFPNVVAQMVDDGIRYFARKCWSLVHL